MKILRRREEGSIWRLGGGEYWAKARRGVSGGQEEGSIGHRQGDESLVARMEREQVAVGPAGRKKPLRIINLIIILSMTLQSLGNIT